MAKKIEIEILAKGKPAERSIDKVAKKTKDLSKTTEKSGSMMTASWAKVGLAIAGVTAALKKASEAHSIQLKAEIALSNALRLNAKEGEATIDMWKDYASGLQEVTLFGDEVTLQQIAMLKTMGLSDDMTKKTIETAMDYATAFGKDMPSAVRELTMTLSGQLGTIKRTIPSIGDFTKEQLKSGEVIDKVSELMKGQAKALADTPWGETQQLANSFGDEVERVGQVTLALASESGGLGFLSNTLSRISEKFSGLTSIIKLFKGELSAEERLNFLDKQIESLEKAEEDKSWLDDFTESVRKQISPLVGLGESAVDTSKKLEKLREARRKLVLEIKNSKFDDEIVTDVPLAELITGDDGVTDAVDESIDKFAEFGKGWKSATDSFATNAKSMQNAGATAANAIGDYLTNMVMGAKSSFSDLTKFVVAQLLKIAIMQRVVTPLGTALGFNMSHTGTSEVKHTGGAIGMAGIPSFHTGMRSDERLAKLQVGEAVINRGGATKNREAIEAMNKGYSVGAGAGNVTQAEINFNVTAIDAASFNQYLVGNKHTIEGIINRSLQTNGTVRQTIKQVV